MNSGPAGEGVPLGRRREGFLVGAVVGGGLAAGPPALPVVVPAPPGRRRASLALGDELLVELTSGGVDLRRLAGRWVEWLAEDGLDADPLVAHALEHLRDYNAPVTELSGGSVAALAAVLPAALASASPKAMIAGSFHVARMLDPAESTALAGMATVLAASALLEGRRDFVPDVVAALRANDADAALLEAIRTIPRDPRAEPVHPVGVNPDPIAATTWLLWTVHHRPRGVEALHDFAMRGDGNAVVGSMLGALMGARDGMSSWPPEWEASAGESAVVRRGLARQLGGGE